MLCLNISHHLSAAFDTVDRSLLLGRMRSAGVIGIAHQWFASYLTSRTQFVCLGRTKSQPSELLQGVPQGSVLGPVLFTLYTGPIGQITRRHQLDFHTFADDSQLYVSFKINDPTYEKTALTRIQACVRELKAWLNHNRLHLNDNKAEVLVITTPSCVFRVVIIVRVRISVMVRVSTTQHFKYNH